MHAEDSKTDGGYGGRLAQTVSSSQINLQLTLIVIGQQHNDHAHTFARERVGRDWLQLYHFSIILFAVVNGRNFRVVSNRDSGNSNNKRQPVVVARRMC